MKQEAGSEEDRRYQYYYLPQQQQQQPPPPPPPSAPLYYGTFQGNPNQPSHPGYPRPLSPPPGQYAYQPAPGYPIIEPISADRDLPPLACCGIGIGWFLFILGWFIASIPWYVGALMLLCTRPDPRERVGLICCTVAAILSLIAAIVGGTTAS